MTAQQRGLRAASILALTCIGCGAYILWGIGGTFLALGIAFFLRTTRHFAPY